MDQGSRGARPDTWLVIWKRRRLNHVLALTPTRRREKMVGSMVQPGDHRQRRTRRTSRTASVTPAHERVKGVITDLINQLQVEASPQAHHKSCHVEETLLHEENMQKYMLPSEASCVDKVVDNPVEVRSTSSSTSLMSVLQSTSAHSKRRVDIHSQFDTSQALHQTTPPTQRDVLTTEVSPKHKDSQHLTRCVSFFFDVLSTFFCSFLFSFKKPCRGTPLGGPKVEFPQQNNSIFSFSFFFFPFRSLLFVSNSPFFSFSPFPWCFIYFFLMKKDSNDPDVSAPFDLCVEQDSLDDGGAMLCPMIQTERRKLGRNGWSSVENIQASGGRWWELGLLGWWCWVGLVFRQTLLALSPGIMTKLTGPLTEKTGRRVKPVARSVG